MFLFWFPTVPLGSIPEMPADSCAEIDASEEGQELSGTYWLRINAKLAGMASETFPVKYLNCFFNTDFFLSSN